MRPRQQETTRSRSNRVATISVSPGKIVGYQGQRISFSAIGKDGSGEIVQGARFHWSSSDTARLEIDDSGQATCIAPGLVWVTASTAFVSTRVPVLIRSGAKPTQTDSEWEADQDQLRPDGTVGTTGGVGALFDSLIDKLAPTVHAQTGGGDSGDFLYDELWSEPRNLTGSPRNRVMAPSRIGPVLLEGSNFEFSVPIVGMAGRGLPLGIGCHYNSRVWSRHGSAVTFNATNTWPYVGFNIGFGRIVTYGSSFRAQVCSDRVRWDQVIPWNGWDSRTDGDAPDHRWEPHHLRWKCQQRNDLPQQRSKETRRHDQQQDAGQLDRRA